MNAYIIAGGVLAAWAVIVALLGMRGFPRSKTGERAAIGITAVLFLGAVGSAIADQTKVGERHGPHAAEVGKLPSGQPTIVLHGALQDWFKQRQLRAHVTLSDETDYATSHVIVEQIAA